LTRHTTTFIYPATDDVDVIEQAARVEIPAEFLPVNGPVKVRVMLNKKVQHGYDYLLVQASLEAVKRLGNLTIESDQHKYGRSENPGVITVAIEFDRDGQEHAD